MTADRRDPTNPFAPTEYPGWMDNTPDNRRAALVERVAKAICTVDEQDGGAPWPYVKSKGGDFLQNYYDRATAAIDLIRGGVLEEAARVADSHTVSPDPVGVIKAMAIAAAIRTRKEKP